MGTSIHCIIPKERNYSVEEIKQELNSLFKKLKPEFLHLEKHGAFTKNVNGKWWFNLVSPENENPEYITGEGDCFSIDIYKNVICIGSTERFSSLYFNESNIAEQLFTIITEISKIFRESDHLLIGAGGFGETDYIMDLAFTKQAHFEELCKKMTELNGSPANNLNELYDKSWYLQ